MFQKTGSFIEFLTQKFEKYGDFSQRCCTIGVFILAHTVRILQPHPKMLLKENLCAKKPSSLRVPQVKSVRL